MTSRTSTAPRLVVVMLIFSSMACGVPLASAAEPKPWNCSGKQSFQNTNPMTFTAKSHSNRNWRLFLMEYEQYTGNHGYSVVTANDSRQPRRRRGRRARNGQIFRDGRVQRRQWQLEVSEQQRPSGFARR